MKEIVMANRKDQFGRVARAGLNPSNIENLLREALSSHRQGRSSHARKLYEFVLKQQSKNFDALHLLGLLELQDRQPERCVSFIRKAIGVNSGVASAHNHLGAGLAELRRYDEAIEAFNRAIALKPDFAEAYLNRGRVLNEAHRYLEAVKSFDKAIEIQPNNSDAFSNRGNALDDLKQPAAAFESYKKALALNPGNKFFDGHVLHSQMEICEWDQLEPQIGHLVERIAAGDAVSTPFPILAITDDPETQRKVAETWVKWKFPSPAAQIPSDFHPKAGKIRVGYFSADFHEHATMYLLAEVLEKRNRDDFEIVAFSFGPDSNDLMRKRAVAAVDTFVDIKRYPDNEVVRLCRSMHIDIAVDLKGYTSGSRVGMFAGRVAPVQVNYLGYPGTMGSGFHDYIIADRITVPAESIQHFSERIVWLPDCYQANDSKRAVSSMAFTREQFGLPADGMVYCCFNNNWKITPTVFDVWMRILSRVDGSVLWLLEDNIDAARNLKSEAQNRGISGDRIIFARRLPLPEHLARHRVADLFLDTLPYNAHTTASDALWAGVPLLTCAGKSFASRVAASLLSAYFMPEMITSSLASYEARAIELGNNREQLISLRGRLSENRTKSPLFDSTTFTRNLETAYRKIHDVHRSGLTPEHFAVGR